MSSYVLALIAFVGGLYCFMVWRDMRRDTACGSGSEWAESRRTVLDYRAWAFTVLIVHVVVTLLKLAVAVLIVLFFLVIAALLSPVGTSWFFWAPAVLAFPWMANVCARLVISWVIREEHGTVLRLGSARRQPAAEDLRERSLQLGRITVLTIWLWALRIYRWACSRLMLITSAGLTVSGEFSTGWRVARACWYALAGSTVLALIAGFAGTLYALPSVYPTEVSEAQLQAAHLYPALFLGVLGVSLVATVELLQWAAERTRHRPGVAVSYGVALFAAAFFGASVEPGQPRFASDEWLNSVAWGAAVGLILAVMWHVGVTCLAVFAVLITPVDVPTQELDDASSTSVRRANHREVVVHGPPEPGDAGEGDHESVVPSSRRDAARCADSRRYGSAGRYRNTERITPITAACPRCGELGTLRPREHKIRKRRVKFGATWLLTLLTGGMAFLLWLIWARTTEVVSVDRYMKCSNCKALV